MNSKKYLQPSTCAIGLQTLDELLVVMPATNNQGLQDPEDDPFAGFDIP